MDSQHATFGPHGKEFIHLSTPSVVKFLMFMIDLSTISGYLSLVRSWGIGNFYTNLHIFRDPLPPPFGGQ